MSSHYGLKVGDKVSYANGLCDEAVVIYLYTLDNNRCKLKDNIGKEFDAVCEWCKKKEIKL